MFCELTDSSVWPYLFISSNNFFSCFSSFWGLSFFISWFATIFIISFSGSFSSSFSSSSSSSCPSFSSSFSSCSSFGSIFIFLNQNLHLCLYDAFFFCASFSFSCGLIRSLYHFLLFLQVFHRPLFNLILIKIVFYFVLLFNFIFLIY